MFEFNSSDGVIIGMQRAGRLTPPYTATVHGNSGQNGMNRLHRLVEQGYIMKLHTGLYEMARTIAET